MKASRVQRPSRERCPEAAFVRADTYLAALGIRAAARSRLIQRARARVQGPVTVPALIEALHEVLADENGATPGSGHASLWTRLHLGREPDALRVSAHPLVLRVSMAPRRQGSRAPSRLLRALRVVRSREG